MTTRPREELAKIYWSDAQLEDVAIDYESVSLRIRQTDRKIVTLRAAGYIGYQVVGFWDEMVIERVEVVEDHPGLRACVDSIKKRYKAEWPETGSDARNSQRWFALLVHLIDGCVLEIYAAALVADV